MSISKTRAHFVDIARQVFAAKGLEGTTMNDIATASGKGRRTLYTYFNNKEEIYYAVIESEIERISEKLDEVAARPMDTEQKIVALIYTHLTMIKEAVVRNGNLRAEFFRNIWMVERMRKRFDQEELDIFIKVMKEGCSEGRIVVDNVHLAADILHYCLKGLEVPFIYGRLGGGGLTIESSRPFVVQLVRRALSVRSPHF